MEGGNETGGMLVAHIMIVVIWRAPIQPGNRATRGEEEEDEKEKEEREVKAGNSEREEDAKLPPLMPPRISLSPTCSCPRPATDCIALMKF